MPVIQTTEIGRVSRRSLAPGDIATCVVALLFLTAFFVLRKAWLHVFYVALDYLFLLPAFAIVAAVFFFNVRYRDFPRPFAALTRASATGVLVYLVAEPPTLTLVYPEHWKLAAYVDWGYWPALGAAILAVWRPSFAFAPAFYIITTRYLAKAISGFFNPLIDIQYLAEMTELLAAGACAVALLRIAQHRWSKADSMLQIIDCRRLALCIAFLAIGVHLGNYFWSGIAKLFLGPHVWSWAIENPTQNLTIGALKRGVLPSGTFPALTQWMFDLFGSVVVSVNLGVLAIQLLAPIAPLRLSMLMAFSFGYEIFHLGTFAFGGLFFWPWVWNNVTVFFAASRGSETEVGWPPKLCCIVAILCGYSPHLADSTRLAWFDVADFKIPMVQVEAPGGHGQWVDVPGSFFMSHSYPISRGYFDMTRAEGHYPPSTWGAVWEYYRVATSGQCKPPRPVSDPETPTERTERLERVRAFIVAHHEKMLRITRTYGAQAFYFRAHHYPSNPWLFKDFNRIDLAGIQRYRLAIESVCLQLVGGRLEQRVIKRDEFVIDVRR